NPNEVDYPVPGNDDAIRAIQFYCDMVSGAILDGVQAEMAAKGLEVSDASESVEAAPKKRAPRKTKAAKAEEAEASAE
ncbi:MAG: 30S ribosomal protein S2, partial [Alphaproteobacteria bacterium]|nr:30S ribosomal protein S2 [Alphaproteobacteria bacterium]